MDEAGFWFALVAAFGAVVSLATLGLMMYYRKRDNETRLKINYQLGHVDDAFRSVGGFGDLGPVAAFRLQNAGRQTVMIVDIHLALEDGTVVRPFSPGNPPVPSQLPAKFPTVFYVGMLRLAHKLIAFGCKDAACFQLVVRAGDDTLHRKPVEIAHLKAWAAGDHPIPGCIEG